MRLTKIFSFASAILLQHAIGISHINCCEENHFFASAALLYWKATEDGLEYVDKFSVVPTTAIFVDGEPQDIDFTWSPGTRLSLGYACGLSDISLTWTYFSSHPDAAVSTDGIGLNFLKPTWFPFLLGGIADHASASWKLDFNTLDLLYRREFCLGQCVSLRPYTGLRAAWIDQTYRVNYHGAYQFIEGGQPQTFFANTSFNAKNDFQSIGLRFGMEGNWFFHPCLSLFANISTSLLYGKLDISEVVNGNIVLESGGTPALVPEILTLNESIRRPRFNIDGFLGLQYKKFLTAWNSCLSASLVYEINFWINQNQLLDRFISINSSPIAAMASNNNTIETISHQQGNLQLYGFNLQFRFDKLF